MNKFIKITLRFWIALTSIATFAVGWVALAHSQKPVAIETQSSTSDQSSTTVADLAPIPSLEDLQTTNRPTFNIPSVNFTGPRLRTRGS